ncbi:MAG: DUF2723 domain-containing protein [Anaerolineae bacterium]|nr:DUF2723 domain-containing protein [Anaerolineae bacterium]
MAVWASNQQSAKLHSISLLHRYGLSFIDLRTLFAFGLPFILYLLTVAPTLYSFDSAELTTAAATGGFVHATGYPLYLMIGWLWSHLPLGDVGYRMNLLSAFCGSLTIALADRILRRLKVGSWAAFGALGVLACSTYFWGLSLIAEVYTLHTALMCGLILLLLAWGDHPTPARLGAVALLTGVSMGNHMATVLLIPGCLWYLVAVSPRHFFTLKSIATAVGAGLLGLSIYLYLPLRYSIAPLPAFNYAGWYDASGKFFPLDLSSPAGLWWLVSGQAFSAFMFSYSGSSLWPQIEQAGIQLSQAFFAVGVGPGLLGLVVLLRHNWRLGGMLLLMFLAHTFFYIGYGAGDKKTMFLPTYLIWALWLGVGYQWLLIWISQTPVLTLPESTLWCRIKTGQAFNAWETGLFRAVIVGLVLLALGWNWSQVNQSNDWRARIRGQTILTRVEANALVFGYWDTAPIVQYLQIVEGQRPDVETINRYLINDNDMIALIKQEISRRPVYIDVVPIELLDEVDVEADGVLKRLTWSNTK